MRISIFNFFITTLLGVSVGLLLLGEMYGLPFIAVFIYIVSLVLYSRYQNVFLYAVLGYLFFGNFILGVLHVRLPFQGYLDELITYGLLSLFFLNKSLSKRVDCCPWIKKYIFIFLTIIFISACVNTVSFKIVFNYISTILKPIVLFY